MQQVFRIIADIRARGTTVLLVEQNAHVALSVADPGTREKLPALSDLFS